MNARNAKNLPIMPMMHKGEDLKGKDEKKEANEPLNPRLIVHKTRKYLLPIYDVEPFLLGCGSKKTTNAKKQRK